MTVSRTGVGKKILRPEKVKKVMHEFKVHTLKSSSGQSVTNKNQAIAIALSEARRPRRARRPKKV